VPGHVREMCRGDIWGAAHACAGGAVSGIQVGYPNGDDFIVKPLALIKLIAGAIDAKSPYTG